MCKNEKNSLINCPCPGSGCRSKLCAAKIHLPAAETTSACRDVQIYQHSHTGHSAGYRKHLQTLPLKVPSVKGFEWGTNNSPEGFNEGLTHCFVVSFDDEKGRQAYWDNPAHNDFVNNHLKPYMEKVLVVDYFVNQ